MKKNELSFEAAMKRLEEIADELEKENVSLDASLKLYEEGVTLVRYCKDVLDGAQRKVNMLTFNTDGEPEEKAFEALSESDGGAI